VYKVYCDFDETVTKRDVGLQLLSRFGTSLALDVWKDLDAGTKSAAECYRIACGTVKDVTQEAFEALVEEQELRDGFLQFVKFCQSNNIELHIVSDGLSLYIERILAKYGLDLPVWTNDVRLAADGSLDVRLTNERESCRRCSSCKCARLLTTSADEDTIVYCGDGYSDHCPVRMADVVFARSTLLRQCGELGIPHHPFEDFYKVQQILSNYLKERPKYRREQAHRRRKELITIE
jgi:2-hydroxy-3-keto-5-methylthiopentenyl-1-phosphate phosphatase